MLLSDLIITENLLEQRILDNTNLIGGIDEVGRGPLAGPIVACCVVFRTDSEPIPDIKDSKTLTPKKRELMAKMITKSAAVWSIKEILPWEIDANGIVRSNQLAWQTSVDGLTVKPDFLLTDHYALETWEKERQLNITKGDEKSYVIACASILAKVHRDQIMKNLHNQHPHYGWDTNVGYGTKKHRLAITRYGLTPHHRTTFCKGL